MDAAYTQFVAGDGSLLWLIFSARNVPPGKFSMSNIFEAFPGDKLFFNSAANGWYLAEAKSIREVIERHRPNYDRVISIGTSMGGYGALLFGSLCHADQIVAFAPNMLLGQKFTHSNYYVKDPPHDYRNLFVMPYKRQPHVFWGVYDPGDALCVERVGSYVNCFRFWLVQSAHDTAGYLHRRAVLEDVLTAAASQQEITVPLRQLASPEEIGCCIGQYDRLGRYYASAQTDADISIVAAQPVPFQVEFWRKRIVEAGVDNDREKHALFSQHAVKQFPNVPFFQVQANRAGTRKLSEQAEGPDDPD